MLELSLTVWEKGRADLQLKHPGIQPEVKKKIFLSIFKHSFSASLESQASIVGQNLHFITLEINPIFDTSGALSKGGQAHI